MRHVIYFFKDIIKAALIGIAGSIVLIVISGGISYIAVSGNILKISDAIQLGTKGQMVNEAQSFLKTAGYYDGDINGSYDNNTMDSVTQFQKDNNIAQTGKIDVLTAEKLSKEVQKINIYDILKRTLYYSSSLILILSAAFFVQRDATRPLIYNEEWKKYFSILNLGFVIMFIGLSTGIVGMFIQMMEESRWFL